MLRGIDSNPIVVGAYVDRDSGGICPMLAAHRNGGRTDLASFARSWDRYTDARRPRLATEREVTTLRSLLESSLVADATSTESLAVQARQIRAERAEMAYAAEAREPEPTLPEPLATPEKPGMRIRIRRLIRRERAGTEPAERELTRV